MLFTLILCTILSLEADFTHVKESKLLQEPQVATGHLSYRSPDQLSWEYRTPTAYKWELGNASTSPQVQQLLQFIVRSISGDILRDDTAFTILPLPAPTLSQGTSNDHSQTINNNHPQTMSRDTYRLSPKKRELKQLFQSIEITLNPATQVAERVVLTEKNGDRSTITFHNTHYVNQ